MIIPSIDIMDGKVVQLRQGKKKVYENDNIDEIVAKYRIFPEVNVIDLNAAMERGNNMEMIKDLCRSLSCNVGGGIRTTKIAKDYINAGANSIIIGTKADRKFLSNFPKDKVIVSLDTKDGKIATNGWRELKNEDIYERLLELEDYCYKFLITNVNVEGLNNYTDLEFFESLVGKTKNDIMVAGGITTIDEVKYINKLGFDQVLGMAVTSGTLDIMECFIEILDFDKQNGLIPTIVQDVQTKKVLMLAYSSKESLKKTYEIRKATYYSRSRNELWTKGEKSGNIQYVEKVYIDCDFDALLFLVRQKGVACHRNKMTCFDV